MEHPRDWPTPGEMLVLKILQDNARGAYGLQVVEQSEGRVKRGSVYVLLGRLEEKGFVKSKRPNADPDYPGLPRPVYRLTADGARVLHAAEQIGLVTVGV